MSKEIKTPELPESVDEATLLAWAFQDGDRVSRDAKLADVETDKVVLEVFAAQDGILRIQAEEGAVLRRGDVLGSIEEGAAAPAKEASPAPAEAAPAPVEEAVAEAPAPAKALPASEPPASANLDGLQGLSPSVRKLVVEYNINPREITGTGRKGRITTRDVENFIEVTPSARTGLGIGPTTLDKVPALPRQKTASVDTADERRVPMSQLRVRVAQRLKEVQNTAAILTTFNEVNMKPVMDIRAKYKEKFQQDYGVKLGFMSFFVKAVVEGLKKYPVVNASIDGRDIVYHEAYHVGIAVNSPRGLVVPVLRNADGMSFAGVEAGIKDLAGRAQEAKLKYDELVGGTFTITNGGVFGSMLSTPILNAPQSAILGMHTIKPRPWVEDGEIVVRPVMYLALSYDHRIVDGGDAVSFLVAVKESLEDPHQLLLQL